MPKTAGVAWLFTLVGAVACGSSQAGGTSALGSDAAAGGGGDDATGAGSSGSGGAAGSTSGSSGAPGSASGASGSSSGPGGSSSSDSGPGASSGSSGAGLSEAGVVKCPSPALAAGDRNESVTVGSTSRTYILHVPSSYTGATGVPLVVDFHALGSSGSGEETTSPYKAETDPESVITAYPDGLSGPAGAAWDVGPCCVANTDDVSFARALVARIGRPRGVRIDPRRVYAVGFSMGGGMSHHYLACHAADLFAAVAPAAFDLLQENEGDCTPPRPIAEMTFRDTGDPIVPYTGGASSLVPGMPVTFLGAVGTFQKWAQIDGCTGSPSAADANGCQFYATCSWRGRGRAVHQARWNPRAGKRVDRLALPQAVRAALRFVSRRPSRLRRRGVD